MGNNQMLININTPAPLKAVEQYYSENAVASSVLTLTENTTAIEIATGGTPIIMRWVGRSDTEASVVAAPTTSANFDHAIPANTVRRFVVPIEITNNGVQVGATATSMVGANIENGLFRRVAYKSQANASVFTSEYGSSNSY